LSTTIWLCSAAILPSVNDDSSGEAVQAPPCPTLGHQRPLPSDDEPHGWWIMSKRCGATPVCACARNGRKIAVAAAPAAPPKNVRRNIRRSRIAMTSSLVPRDRA